MRSLTANDAEDWRLDLVSQKLADNTVRRRCGIAKQFFRYAVKRGYVEVNPFADLVAVVHGNPQRQFFVTRDMIGKVIDACPDVEWRLIVALSRYAGLRYPSEHLGLLWSEVDWANGWFIVHSPKTEHHEHGAFRRVPLFPELFPFMREAFERAEPGAVHVIARYRQSNCNLRTQFMRFIKRAGLKPWPKLFHNLRSSCQTELAERYIMKKVCAFLGNSEPVAVEHYLQVTDDDYRKAAGHALQNPVQQATEAAGSKMQGEEEHLTQVEAGGTVSDMMLVGATACNGCEELGNGPG